MYSKDLRYILTKPSKFRKRFALVCYKPEDRQTKVYVELAPALRASLDAANKQYLSKSITETEATILLQDLIQEQYRRGGVQSAVLKQSVISKANYKILNSYWSDMYAQRFLSDERSMRYDLELALRLIEPLSIATATQKEMLAKLKSQARSRAQMRRAIDRMNQLLRYLGREKLPKPPADVGQIEYLTVDEIRSVMRHLTGDIKDLVGTLFGSGARLSEALALTVQDYLKGRLNINKQISPDGEMKLPKRGKTGRSFVIPEFQEYVARWVRVENKQVYRTRLFNELQRACKLAKNTVVGPHDLRHSHAIYLLSKGATLKQVALNLRNRTDVCEQYYTGFVHTDETIESLKDTLSTK